MQLNIPETRQKRVLIAGGGFAGLKIATKLADSDFQVVLIDKNNFHQFQPLFYQVATAGLEPSAISFPLRKIFHSSENVFIRVAEITGVNTINKEVITTLGSLTYDILVLAMGVDTNFFGMKQIAQYAIPMKSVAEALSLRNKILQNFEDALIEQDAEKKKALLNIVVVGGGPTGVEVSGTLAEMRKFILPKDYPEIDFSQMNIYLVEAGSRVLGGMTEQSASHAKGYLHKLGVKVLCNAQVSEYDGEKVSILNNIQIPAKTLVWAAGVSGSQTAGLNTELYTRGNRIKVNSFNQVEGFDDIYALGDNAYMTESNYPNGHPQMAQPAIQQAKLLAQNLKRQQKNKPMKPYHYFNKGSMATIGRNLAVVELPFVRFYGFFAWLTWMFVHLMAIVGVKNRLLVFINWFWNYVTYDQSLRLIIKPAVRKDG
ncbi:MAG: NAD(P)/FAD-dependent oxidoreductase [Bacteroidales bacterium]|nr:NAD(P)/FAD-dependent oxidoreductase [Bacteroidales bacterium]